MNWRRGLFRFWLVVSALWLIVVVVFFYSQVVSPYIEPQAYILTDDLKFFELDNVSDSEDRDFKAAYQIEIDFPNKVTLFAKDNTPQARP
jgi:type II secretory pathway component PulL